MDHRHGPGKWLPPPLQPRLLSFRARLVVAVAAMTAATLGGAFAIVSYVVNQDQQHHLDAELVKEARHEAEETAKFTNGQWTISERPGPAAHHVGPLPKYAALYDAEGHVVAATATLESERPDLEQIRSPDGQCFDIRFQGLAFRAVTVPFPRLPGAHLFLAIPRTDLDHDATFLARAMEKVWVLACGWAILVAYTVVRRLTKNHDAIMEVAHRVADGDLTARVGSRAGDPETAQLGRDIDHMIERLATLVASQKRFIAYAAHELRSPLTTLYGELSHSLRRSRDAETYRRAIEEALDSTYRLKNLAEDLLALARLGALPERSKEPVLFRDVVEAAVQSTKKFARDAQVELQVDQMAEDVRVLGRPRDLERLLRNLVENAIRHSPTGAIVLITIEVLGGRLRVAVTDEGPGVPEEDRRKIFEPFFRHMHRSDDESSGVGLGLAIAGEIAHAHYGDIYVEDCGDHRRGARFVFTLPLGLEKTDRPAAGLDVNEG